MPVSCLTMWHINLFFYSPIHLPAAKRTLVDAIEKAEKSPTRYRPWRSRNLIVTYNRDINTCSKRLGDTGSQKAAHATCLGPSETESESRVTRDDWEAGPARSMSQWEDRAFTHGSFRIGHEAVHRRHKERTLEAGAESLRPGKAVWMSWLWGCVALGKCRTCGKALLDMRDIMSAFWKPGHSYVDSDMEPVQNERWGLMSAWTQEPGSPEMSFWAPFYGDDKVAALSPWKRDLMSLKKTF